MVLPNPNIFSNQNSPDYDWGGYNELRRALIKLDYDVARRLINDGVEVNPKSAQNHSDTPLHLAVMSSYPEITELLLSKGANIQAKDWNMDTPITLAAKMENRDLANVLLSHGVQNHENEECFSHLHVACAVNRVDIVEKLVLEDYAANINKIVSKHSMFWPGYTPLHFSVHYGCIETVECLLKLGADMMIQDCRGLTPLHLAHLQRNVRIIDLLLAAHKNEFKNPVNQHGISHFHIACSRDDSTVLDHFMHLNVNVEDLVPPMPRYESKLPWQWFAPIDFAMYHGCPRNIKFLLDARVSLNTRRFSCLLEHAFMEQNKIIHDLFTPKKFTVINHSQKAEGISEMHWAAIQNDVEAMEQSLNASADIPFDFNTPIPMGLTALHLSIKYHSKEVVQSLLDHGANILVQDSNGETPIHTAFKCKYIEILKLLWQYLTCLTKNLVNCDGLSVFHILCTTDKVETIKNLLHTGVDLNAQVSNKSVHWAGFTALHFACLSHQIEVVKLLLAYNADMTIKNSKNLIPFDLMLENVDSNESHKISKSLSYLSIIMLRGANKTLSIQGISRLHLLCINMNIDSEVMRQYVLSHKDEINRVTNIPRLRQYNKCTSLHFAILFENFAHANLLLEYGADPFVMNDEGKTPLECMFSSNLLFSRKSVQIENCFTLGTSVQSLKPSHFYVACALSLFNVISEVLDKVSDKKLKTSLVNCCDNRGCTPLHFLSREIGMIDSRDEFMHLLLTHGADVNVQNYKLDTPLHVACREEDYYAIKLLVEHGSDVNAQNIYIRTPFHSLLLSLEFVRRNDIIILFLDNGADINLLDRQGRTCFMILRNDLEIAIDGIDEGKFMECFITYLKHIKKLHLIGSYIRKRNLRAYSGSLDLVGDNRFKETLFIDECRKELDTMESVQVDRYTTLRDILTKSLNEMVFHCDNVNLREMVDSNYFCEKYPNYGSIVRLQLKTGRIRKPLLIESKECFMNVIGIKLPQSCLEAILQHLSNKDLINITMSKEVCG